MIIVIVLSALVGAGTAWLLTANRCEDEAQRRFADGVEHGRFLERNDLDWDQPTTVGVIAAARRIGRLRRAVRAWSADEQRRAVLADMVARGVGR